MAAYPLCHPTAISVLDFSLPFVRGDEGGVELPITEINVQNLSSKWNQLNIVNLYLP